MVSIWVPVVAALGAALLTGAASLGVAWVQAHWRAAEDRKRLLGAACSEVLASSMLVANRARVLSSAIEARSGLKESIDLVLYRREPIDPMKLYDWWATDMSELHRSVSEVWVRGDGRMRAMASDIELQCAKLLELATSIPGQQTFMGRLRGVKRDEQFATNWLREVKALGDLRVQFLKATQQALGPAATEVVEQLQ